MLGPPSLGLQKVGWHLKFQLCPSSVVSTPIQGLQSRFGPCSWFLGLWPETGHTHLSCNDYMKPGQRQEGYRLLAQGQQGLHLLSRGWRNCDSWVTQPGYAGSCLLFICRIHFFYLNEEKNILFCDLLERQGLPVAPGWNSMYTRLVSDLTDDLCLPLPFKCQD